MIQIAKDTYIRTRYLVSAHRDILSALILTMRNGQQYTVEHDFEEAVIRTLYIDNLS